MAVRGGTTHRKERRWEGKFASATHGGKTLHRLVSALPVLAALQRLCMGRSGAVHESVL